MFDHGFGHLQTALLTLFAAVSRGQKASVSVTLPFHYPLLWGIDD
jgi:hypothetical protein